MHRCNIFVYVCIEARVVLANRAVFGVVYFVVHSLYRDPPLTHPVRGRSLNPVTHVVTQRAMGQWSGDIPVLMT